MKVLWVLTFLIVFSAEVRVKAKGRGPSQGSLSCPESWIESDQLLSGCHWLTTKSPMTLTTVYGQILARNADFYVDYRDQKIQLFNHYGEIQVQLKDGRSVMVPPGFGFWFSELNQDRQNQMGQLTPIELKGHLANLGPLWSGKPTEFKRKIEDFKMRWGNRTEITSIYYKSLAERNLASVRAQESQVQLKRNEEKKRQAENKKLLYQRAFER